MTVPARFFSPTGRFDFDSVFGDAGGGAVRKRAEGLQGEGTMTKDAGQRSHSQGCRSKTPWPSKDAGG